MQSPTRRTARIAPLTLASLIVLAQLVTLLAFVPGAQAITISAVADSTGTTTSSLSNGGETVTITGTEFSQGTEAVPRVLFGGVPATNVVVNSATSITAKSPPHAAGGVIVQVINPDGEFAGFGYSYVAAPVPVITSLTAIAGASNGGTSFTVGGTGFAADADHPPVVTLGGTRATVTPISDTSFTVTSPPHASGNNLPFILTNPDGQSDSTVFSYVPSAAPTIVSLSPTGGVSNGGTSVTLVTTNVVAGASVTVGGVLAKITSLTASAVTITTPPHAAGATDIIITNPDGQSATRTAAFTYTSDNAPTITNVKVKDTTNTITRTTLNTAGGTEIIITGTNFHTGSNAQPAVTIGGTPLLPEFVTVDSALQITAFAFPHAAGNASVTVQNPDGKLATGPADLTYVTPRQLNSISPATGTSNGGTTLTLTGVGFQSGARVMFGSGTPVASTGSGTTLTVVTPANPLNTALTVDLTVINPDGTRAMLSSPFTYAIATALPTVTSISPTQGSTNGGTEVTITGTNFHAGSNAKPTVTVDGLLVPEALVTVNSAVSITIVTPTHGVGELDVNIQVTNPATVGQASSTAGSGDDFDYLTTLALQPAVTSVSPATATTNGGVTVTISATAGNYHTGANAKPTVTVGGIPATVVSVASNGNSMTIIVPATGANVAVEDAHVAVFNPDGQENNDIPGDDFDYTAVVAAPTIASRSPISGSSVGGNTVTLTGTGFSPTAPPTVTFGGVAALVGTVTTTTVSVTAPGHPIQSGVQILLTNPNGQSATSTYTYTAGSAPAITGITPATAAATSFGFVMTITGTNLGLDATLTVGATQIQAAQVCTGTDLAGTTAVKGCTARSLTSVSFVIPAGTANTVATVSVANKDGQSASATAFRYLLAPPVFSGSSGTSGTNGGDTVTFTGSIALQTSPRQMAAVDGVFAAANGAASAITPARATPGSVATQVFDVDGQSATRASGATYVTDAPPLIAKVAPPSCTGCPTNSNAGPSRGGTIVAISGYYFGTFHPSVTIGGLEAIPCTGGDTPFVGCAAPTSTQIRVVTSPHAAGLTDLVVTNLDGQSATSTGAFQFLGSGGALAPTLTSVSPVEGPTDGGTAVTLVGTNFASGATVKFGTLAATDVTFVSATQVTAKSPAGSLGKVGVTVTNPDNQASTKADAFEYKTSTTATTTTSTGTTTTSTGTTTTGSTSTSGTGTPSDAPTNAEIQAVNGDVDVDVTRDGNDNLIAFTLPSDLPADAEGVQVWRSTSPFVLVANIDDQDADFDAGEYRDVNAPAGAKYLVTVFYANSLGFSSCLIQADCTGSALPPGFAALGDGFGRGGGGIATWVWVLIGGLALVLIVVIIVLVSRRRPPAEPVAAYGWNQPSDEPAVAPESEETGPVNQTSCPSCKTRFSVTGTRPVKASCPNCGKAGILR